ncbi:MAG TPA: hypothetical protein VNI57_04455, partial [Candidatus Saccharimonadales bacterium]|nr:hypothetical protein [Candidatus Saccharimonadales bacterium]
AASAGADWRLNDRWTLSGSLSRETYVATARTLERGVGLAAATATAGWTPLSSLGTRLSVQRMETSDGNGRDLLSGYARWTLPVNRPRLALSWNGRYLSYDDPQIGREDGYFAPDFFVANVAGFEISDTLRGRVGLSAEGTLGLQEVRVLPGSERTNDTVRGWYLRASWAIGSRVSLEAWLGRTNLALQGPAGFGSVESGIRLRWKTGWPSHGGVSR